MGDVRGRKLIGSRQRDRLVPGIGEDTGQVGQRIDLVRLARLHHGVVDRRSVTLPFGTDEQECFSPDRHHAQRSLQVVRVDGDIWVGEKDFEADTSLAHIVSTNADSGRIVVTHFKPVPTHRSKPIVSRASSGKTSKAAWTASGDTGSTLIGCPASLRVVRICRAKTDQ